MMNATGIVRKICDCYSDWNNKLILFNQKKSTNYILWTLVVSAIFSVLLLLNILTPMTADDFGYLYIHGEESIRVTSIADVIQSQYNHYMSWGGRSVVHFIAQSLLLLPPFVIDILNSLMYILYTFLIYCLIKGKDKGNISFFILVNLAIWFIQPAFGDTILWITGSANYLWGTSLILLFLLPFRLYMGEKSRGMKQIIYAVLFLIYGIIAGWSNENTAGAMILMSILFLLYYKKQSWTIPAWAIAGIVGAIVGYVIMIVAPGNATRAGEAGELGVFIVCYRFLMHSLTLFTQYGMWLLTYCILAGVYYRFSKNGAKDSSFYTLLFFIGSLASIYVMIFSPSFPPRAWFGALSYLLIAVGILFINLDFKELFLRRMKVAVLGIGSIAFLFSFYLAARDVAEFYSIYEDRQVSVATAKGGGQTTCEFERYVAKTKFVHTEDELSNHLMSDYYGLEITFKESLRK